MAEELIIEFRKLSSSGGWILWGLIILAFGIASGLLGVAMALWQREARPGGLFFSAPRLFELFGFELDRHRYSPRCW